MNWIRWIRFLNFTTAILLLFAALWFGLYEFGLTRQAQPSYDPSLPRGDYLQAFFSYKQVFAWQEIGYTLVAALAFLLIAPIGAMLRQLLDPHTPEASLASTFFGAAASLLVAGQLVQVGTQWAILSQSKREFNDVAMLAIVWDTGLIVSNWLENGGYFSLALGLIGWAMVGRGVEPRPRAWIALSWLLSSVLLIVVVSQSLEIWTIYDIALPLSGVVLAPAWFFWTAQVCNRLRFTPESI